MRARCSIIAIAAVLALPACGDDDGENSKDAAPSPKATTAATASALDESALKKVRDALSECLAAADVGVVVDYADGEASANSAKVETGLAAPEATKAAVADGAQYVGLRDDQDEEGLTPNLDILVHPSEKAAKAATVPLSEEVGDPAGATQSGRYVTVVRPEADASGDDPETADAKIAECQQQAEGAA